MTGFDPFENDGLISFEGTRYAGAEVRVRLDLPYGKLLEFEELATLKEEVEWVLKHAIIEWNLEKDGKPIPIDTPLEELPFRLLSHVTIYWYKALNEISAPLEQASPNGDTSAEG